MLKKLFLCVLLGVASFDLALCLKLQASPKRSPSVAVPVIKPERLSVLDVSGTLAQGISHLIGIRYLGWTSQNHFLVTLDENPFNGINHLYWIDPHAIEATRSASTPSLNCLQLRLSPDGRLLSGFEDTANNQWGKDGNLCAHNLVILDSNNLNKIAALDVGRENNIHGANFMQENIQQVITRITTLSPYGGSGVYTNDRVDVWNWKTRRKLNSINYRHAKATNAVLFSHDGKQIACVFLDEEQDLHGIVDMLNPSTGQLIWHISSSTAVPVGLPFFYLPDGRFVSKERVYNIRTKQSEPLLPGHARLRCVSGLPAHTGLAFLQSEQGLELWDIMAQKRINRWPQIQGSGQVCLSPDATLMAVVTSPEASEMPIVESRKTMMQFWKFNPRWLRKTQQ